MGCNPTPSAERRFIARVVFYSCSICTKLFPSERDGYRSYEDYKDNVTWSAPYDRRSGAGLSCRNVLFANATNFRGVQPVGGQHLAGRDLEEKRGLGGNRR